MTPNSSPSPTPTVEQALDILHRASVYISNHWRADFSRAEAQANLNARTILFNCSNLIFIEHGVGISREEVEGAAIIEGMVP